MLPMRWKRAEGTRPGRSLTTLRCFLRLLNLPSSTAPKPREIRFPDDLLRRHHLYVARIRMGKSTLMHHVITHRMREKAAGRYHDAIVVIDPHADLVDSLLERAPTEIEDQVRLIDLADEERAPGINPLDTRVFADRDRTADSVVRVARGLWDQWGPRMQSILEHVTKTPPRGQRARRTQPPVHHPQRAAAALGGEVQDAGTEGTPRPLPAQLVGARLRILVSTVPRRVSRSRPNPTLLLRVLQARAPSSDSPDPPSTCARSYPTAESCSYPPPRPPPAGTSRHSSALPSSISWTPSYANMEACPSNKARRPRRR